MYIPQFQARQLLDEILLLKHFYSSSCLYTAASVLASQVGILANVALVTFACLVLLSVGILPVKVKAGTFADVGPFSRFE